MHSTERAYDVVLERATTGSTVTITVHAVSTAQAMRKAENEMPGWTAKRAA